MALLFQLLPTLQFISDPTCTGKQMKEQKLVYNVIMNKTKFHIMPEETYVVHVGDHNVEMIGIDVLAILEAAFDEAQENHEFVDIENMEKYLDSLES